jgi:hypothetical protein
MDSDPDIDIQRPELVRVKPISLGTFENLSDIWAAAEAFTSPHLEKRTTAFERLVSLQAVQSSPLIAYLLATRLADPDIHLRTRIVKSLADVLSPDDQGRLAPESVRSILVSNLSAMRARPIFALLQVVDFDQASEPMVARLLSYCSFAGGHLADILSNRQAPIAVRKQAAYFIGRIGYLDALPALERMAARLEGRRSSFLSGLNDDDEAGLLQLIQDALTLLRSP